MSRHDRIAGTTTPQTGPLSVGDPLSIAVRWHEREQGDRGYRLSFPQSSLTRNSHRVSRSLAELEAIGPYDFAIVPSFPIILSAVGDSRR